MINFFRLRTFILSAGCTIVLSSCFNEKKMSDTNNAKMVKNDTSKILKAGAELKLISSQFSFTEGPAMAKNGDVYFTDQPNDKIWKYSADGTLSLFMENTGRSNGMFIDKENNIWSCADQTNDIWRISLNKDVKKYEITYQGHKINGPNDLWVHPNGDIYFTDPYYQRSWWSRTASEIGHESVYYLPKGTTEAVLADGNFVKPNGIIGTPDGKTLYVADIGDKKTYRYDIGQDGKLNNKQLFANLGSDGMTIDHLGNVYFTGNGVTVFNKEGKQVEHITVPEGWTANVCFSGEKKDRLFITASKSVYTIDTKVHGVQ